MSSEGNNSCWYNVVQIKGVLTTHFPGLGRVKENGHNMLEKSDERGRSNKEGENFTHFPGDLCLKYSLRSRLKLPRKVVLPLESPQGAKHRRKDLSAIFSTK